MRIDKCNQEAIQHIYTSGIKFRNNVPYGEIDLEDIQVDTEGSLYKLRKYQIRNESENNKAKLELQAMATESNQE